MILIGVIYIDEGQFVYMLCIRLWQKLKVIFEISGCDPGRKEWPLHICTILPTQRLHNISYYWVTPSSSSRLQDKLMQNIAFGSQPPPIWGVTRTVFIGWFVVELPSTVFE